MNDKPFSYTSHYGTEFVCDRCDFKTPLIVKNQPSGGKQRMSDVAEMIGYHATNIYPELNGFQGYDCIQFSI